MRVLSQVVHTKDVNFCGVTLTVPSRVDYLAADKDGKVWGYEAIPPELSHRFDRWLPADPGAYEYDEIADVDLEGSDWTQTLTEV